MEVRHFGIICHCTITKHNLTDTMGMPVIELESSTTMATEKDIEFVLDIYLIPGQMKSRCEGRVQRCLRNRTLAPASTWQIGKASLTSHVWLWVFWLLPAQPHSSGPEGTHTSTRAQCKEVRVILWNQKDWGLIPILTLHVCLLPFFPWMFTMVGTGENGRGP